MYKATLYVKLGLLAERVGLTARQRDFEEAYARGSNPRGMGMETHFMTSLMSEHDDARRQSMEPSVRVE